MRTVKGSIRQGSPGSWELTVDIGRDALGKRRRRHATVRGTKAAAQSRLREFLSAIDRGMEFPHGRLLMRDWLDRWLREEVAPHRRQRSKEGYTSLVERHIVSYIGHIELSRLGLMRVQVLESKLVATMAPRLSNWCIPYCLARSGTS